VFERNPNIVEIDIGDPTDRVPSGLAEKFKAVTHPRRHAWNAALKAKFDAEKVAAAEPKLKKIDQAAAGPQLKPIKVKVGASPMVARSGPIIEELPDSDSGRASPSSMSASNKFAASSSNGSASSAANAAHMPIVEEMDEGEDVELSKEDYFPLIRVIQLLLPVCKTTAYGCVSKKELRKAFECGAYAIKLPVITMTFEEYYEAARAAGVVEIREIKKRGRASKVGLCLAEQWRDYKVPAPSSVTKITPKVWNLFIDCCKLKPNAQHKKSSLLRWAKGIKTELQKEAEDVLLAMVELSVYSGAVIMDISAGKYTPNLHQKKYPIDRTVCPKFVL
jgi:hypothetical protein